ncbi:hypothetical protein ABW20_dc0108978 [Dactylellina cionopaga]|nr:hypothetical protein ABW20_dc0108978 [Dactylellina cionopaga]
MASAQSPEITAYGPDAYFQPQDHWMHQPASTANITRKPVPYTAINPPSSPESKEQNEQQQPPNPSKWGVTWQGPAWCLLSFFSGVAVAIGHHVYFTKLNNTPYENVVWVGRYSLVLALIVKTCFATCILLCYEQVVWVGLRHKEKGTSIRAIDALFGATYQVVSLLHPAMWIQHPLSAIMITIRWLLPLVSIITPTTLTVQNRESVGFTNYQVPTLNLSAVAQNTLDLPPNGTYFDDLGYTEYTGNRWFATSFASKVGTLTGFLGGPVNYPSPCGSNCSYSISFNAALMKCTDADPHNKTAPWEVDNNTSAPWATSRKGKENDYTSIYKYVSQISNTTGNLWVGHLIRKNVSQEDVKTFWDSWDVETFYCEGYNSTVSLRQEFVGGEQRDPVVESMEYGNIIDYTTSNSWAYENNISVTDLGRHEVVYDVLSKLFAGTVNYEGRSGRNFFTDTSILSMPAFIKPNLVSAGDGPNDELKDSIRGLTEQLSLNYSMSLLAYPNLGIRQMTTANCTATTFSNVWRYEQRNLIIAYSIGTVIALVSVAVGALALAKNGVVSEISFSQVVATTRNPELDKLVQGNCLGRSDLQPRNIYRTRLRLGELKVQDGKISASGAAHAGFGTPENVVAIRRKAYYI